MNCSNCTQWLRERRTVYGDGSVLVDATGSAVASLCRKLDRWTDADFGCIHFVQVESEADQLVTETKVGAPWQHWHMIPCPKCSGGPDSNARCQCAGTGNVRLYDDGFVGDERTRKHPKEIEAQRHADASSVDPGTVLAPTTKPDVTV